MTGSPYNPYEIARQQLLAAADWLELDQPTRDLLGTPLREYHFSIPIRMDDGAARIFRGYRVQHNDARGPGKGGIRFHPQQTIDTLRALAVGMTWNCALVDLPLGGSMGGIVCDPHNLSALEQERLCRGWVRQMARNVGPDWDVPAPDLMTTPQHMLWMLDEFETIKGAKSPGFITGKPVGMGGSLGRVEATGYGIVICLREALKDRGVKVEGTRASFQGFGQVAQNAVRLYQQMGGTVAAVSCWDQKDSTAYTYTRKDGIALPELLPITNSFGEIDPVRAAELGYERLPGSAWLEQDVDILVTAAIDNQVTPENAGRIPPRVKLIAEGASGSTNPEAEEIVRQRGIQILPDILANAGGVTASYFEQVQSNMNYYWRKDEVLGKLDVQMTGAYESVCGYATQHRLDLRRAALIIAVDRVARACRERGWV
ncbi:MAG TPA: Glu/Leu/Phe/Val dehydrogenase [Anaerolineaceae bacterium]